MPTASSRITSKRFDVIMVPGGVGTHLTRLITLKRFDVVKVPRWAATRIPRTRITSKRFDMVKAVGWRAGALFRGVITLKRFDVTRQPRAVAAPPVPHDRAGRPVFGGPEVLVWSSQMVRQTEPTWRRKSGP